MTMFRPALARVKRDYQQLLPESTITACLQRCGHAGRRRILTPAQSVYLLLLQILHACSLVALRHHEPLSATASAICQARAKLPLALWYGLVEHLSAALVQRQATPQSGLFHDLEVLLLDGTSTQSQDTPQLARHYRKPKNQHGVSRGYPSVKLVCLVHYATGLITRMIDLPGDRQEHRVLARLRNYLGPRRVVLADRGLVSFGFLAQLGLWGAHACLRLREDLAAKTHGTRQTVQVLSRSAHLVDRLVCWSKPPRPGRSLSRLAWAGLPDRLPLREVTYRLVRPGFRPTLIRVITTLLDPKEYPAEEIAELYLKRWQIEVYFRDLKRSQKLLRLRARSLAGARKELCGHVLLYNLVRGVMLDAATRQGVAPDRISFLDALRYLQSAAAADAPMALVVNPRRRRPAQPRRIKYVNFRYPTLRHSRAAYQQRLNAPPVYLSPLT